MLYDWLLRLNVSHSFLFLFPSCLYVVFLILFQLPFLFFSKMKKAPNQRVWNRLWNQVWITKKSIMRASVLPMPPIFSQKSIDWKWKFELKEVEVQTPGVRRSNFRGELGAHKSYVLGPIRVHGAARALQISEGFNRGVKLLFVQLLQMDELKDQITPHVKPSDCYETKVMTWDGGSRWWLDGKEVGGWIDG